MNRRRWSFCATWIATWHNYDSTIFTVKEEQPSGVPRFATVKGATMTNTPNAHKPRYSGKDCGGVCVCGHRWQDHHLSMVMRQDYVEETGEYYFPEECEYYGFNETGGLDAKGRPHCDQYQDRGVRPKPRKARARR